MDEAHQMYGAIFGLEHSRHYFVSESSDATSNRENSWDLTPGKLFFSNRGRGARQQRKARSFVIDTVKQAEILREHQEKLTRQSEQIDAYFKDDILDFTTIDTLDSHARKVFLKWISTAIAMYAAKTSLAGDTISQTISTELDFSVDITINRSQRVLVNCEDGKLEMPKITMKRRSI